MKIGSVVFHDGIIFAFIGHAMGMLVLIEVYEVLGVNEQMYHIFVISGGGVAGVPVLFKLHVILSFILFTAISFTKLVHMFSFPLCYLARAPQQYRARNGYNKKQ